MIRGRGFFSRGRGNFRGRGRSPPRRRRSPSSSQSSRESFYCSYCKSQFSHRYAFDEHHKSAVHKQKRKVIESAIAEDSQFCYTCERNFPNKVELDAHCLMSRHQPLYRVEEIHGFRRRQEEGEKDMDAGKNKRHNRHVEDRKDNKYVFVKDAEEPEKQKMGERNMAERSTVFCQLCQVNCMNASNYKIHIESWRHRAEEDKRKEEREKKELEKKTERNITDNEDKAKTNSKVSLNVIGALQYFCEVCSVPCTGQENYIGHCRGKKHLRRILLLQRPFKCFPCNETFNADKPFNAHLESRSHIEKAFKGRNKETKGQAIYNDEWVEKKNDVKNDEEVAKPRSKFVFGDFRKVEIQDSPATDVDLRDRLKGKNLVVTRHSGREESSASPPQNADPAPKLERGDMDKRAQEMEFEAKFKKISRDYENDLVGLKRRLLHEREMDISAYQQYENTYKRLCEEEDFIRENLRVLEESDPRKEEYIRDMIRIQRDMREVRQELEFREMMIIKRESLFRAKFPDGDNKVRLDSSKESMVIDYRHGAEGDGDTQSDNKDASENDDLRVKLERERLLKRLAPELESLDPSVKEKLLSVIMNKDDADVSAAGDEKRANEMAFLTQREKDLEKELEQLRSKAPSMPTVQEKNKITRSLVPQYDDDADDKSKKRHRRRSRSSNLSESSSESSSAGEGRHAAKKKRRKNSPLYRSRGRSKRSRSSERGQRRRRGSRDRKKKSSARKSEDRRRKSGRSEKKPIKITLQARQSESKVKVGNPLPEDSDIEIDLDEQPQDAAVKKLTVVSKKPLDHRSKPTPAAPKDFAQQLKGHVVRQPRKEQFSLWNRASNKPSTAFQSPKEDVWDIAFSGAKAKEPANSDTLNLFTPNRDAKSLPQELPADILNILRNVAPIIQNMSSLAHPQQQNASLFSNLPSFMQNTAPAPTPQPQRPHSESGQKIRSILKKIKDDTGPVSEPAPPVTKPQETYIPGLEPSVSDPASKGLDNRFGTPRPGQYTKDQRAMYESRITADPLDRVDDSFVKPNSSSAYTENDSALKTPYGDVVRTPRYDDAFRPRAAYDEPLAKPYESKQYIEQFPRYSARHHDDVGFPREERPRVRDEVRYMDPRWPRIDDGFGDRRMPASLPPTSNYNPSGAQEALGFPVKRQGESEDMFYGRFERFYAMKRESDRSRLPAPPPAFSSDGQAYRQDPPPSRFSQKDDFYRRSDLESRPPIDEKCGGPLPPFRGASDRGLPYDDFRRILRDSVAQQRDVFPNEERRQVLDERNRSDGLRQAFAPENVEQYIMNPQAEQRHRGGLSVVERMSEPVGRRLPPIDPYAPDPKKHLPPTLGQRRPDPHRFGNRVVSGERGKNY